MFSKYSDFFSENAAEYSRIIELGKHSISVNFPGAE